MANRPKDDLLDRARAAEEKLRGILERRSDPTGAGWIPPAWESETVLADDVAPSDDGSILALVEPGGAFSWGLRLIPASMEPRQLPDDEASIATPIIYGLASAVPLIALAIQRGRLFELIGPAPALNGLRSGMLEMIPAKSGGLLGGIRVVGEKGIVHQARFRAAELAGTIGPGLAIVAASAVLGHMHMVEIRRQLSRIEGKVDRVLEGQHAARHGKLVGSTEVLSDVARSRATGAMGDLDFHRLAGAELDLRQIAAELGQLHRSYSGRTEALRGAGLAPFIESFNGARQIEINDARLYLAATAALVEVERLLVANVAFNDARLLAVRENALRAATERLASVDRVIGHLRDFQSHCRQALDQDQARSVRLSSADNDRVSEELRQDRLAIAELFATAQHILTEPDREKMVNVVRVDARGGRVRAQVAFLEPET